MSYHLIGRITVMICLSLATLARPVAPRAAQPGVLPRGDGQGRLPIAPAALATLMPDPLVTQMIAQVTQPKLYDYVADLSGARPVTIGGSAYTLATRSMLDATAIQVATQYAFERLQAMGLQARYHNWTAEGVSGRNVVAEKPGAVHPLETVLITAHLDDVPTTGPAPGADDDGSGSAGVLAAAETLSRYPFERTLRFVLFTGEEHWLYGSHAYAGSLSGENIVAVYNIDRIAWDGAGGPVLELHTRLPASSGFAGDLQIANLFLDVVTAYGLAPSLAPAIVSDGPLTSAHAAFWSHGFPAILATEDTANDGNPYYHTLNDKLSNLNLAYFTNFVKASVGTAAHLARPLDPIYAMQVTPAEAAQSADPGATVQYALQVRNTGNASDSFAVSLGGRAWATTAPSQVGPLGPGAGERLNVTVTVPAGALPGAADGVTVTVASLADPAHQASARLTTTARSFYNVLLEPANQEGWGDPGTPVIYGLRITNTGNTTDVYHLAATAQAWPTALAPAGVGPLDPGAAADIAVVVHVPPSAADGDDDAAVLHVASQGRPACIWAATLTTRARRLHGVALAPPDSHAQALPGHAVAHSLRITNTGSLADTFWLTIGSHAWPAELDPPAGSIPLAPHASTPLQVVVHVPAVPGQATDSLTIAVTSAGDPAQWAAARLTTDWIRLRIWLSMLRR